MPIDATCAGSVPVPHRLARRALYTQPRGFSPNTFQISPPDPPKGGENREIPPSGGLGGRAGLQTINEPSYLKGIGFSPCWAVWARQAGRNLSCLSEYAPCMPGPYNTG